MTLAFLVFFPMIAAVLSYVIGKHNKAARDNFVIVSCLITLCACVSALLGVIRGEVYTLTIPGFTTPAPMAPAIWSMAPVTTCIPQ